MAENNPISREAPTEAAPESGPCYRIITRYWPRMAVALVALAGIAEWVVGGITSNGALELFVFAWATTTGGLWFLFEKAEKTLSSETRGQVVGWMAQSDFKRAVSSIPDQFASLFDRVFGERHLSWRCFWRSAVASVFAAWIVTLLWAVPHPPPSPKSGLVVFLGITGTSIIFNLIPDYFSLLETRYILASLQHSRRVAGLLLVDLCATAVLGLFGCLLFYFLVSSASTQGILGYVWEMVTLQYGVTIVGAEGALASDPYHMPLSVFFYSTFLTSIWLWLYAASVLVSRVLVRMGGGVGFLLKVTDVEKHPFRSMGFTSVVLVSLLFLVGLPFVLLS